MQASDASRRAGAAGGSRRERRNAADHAGAGPRPHDDRADRAAACRLPGAAKIRTAQARGPDQQRSDLRGRAGPMAPDDVARSIEKAFGAHIPEARKASVKPGEQVKQADEATFVAALRRMRLSQAATRRSTRSSTAARTRRSSISYPPGCAALHVGARSDAPLPERRVPRARTPEPRLDARVRRRGGRRPQHGPISRFDFSPSYGRNTFAARALLDGYGRDLVLPVYRPRADNHQGALGRGRPPARARHLRQVSRSAGARRGHAVAGAPRSGGRADQAVKRRTGNKRARSAQAHDAFARVPAFGSGLCSTRTCTE